MKQRSFLLSYQRECSSSSNLAAAKKDTRSPTNKSIPYKSPLKKCSPYSLVKKVVFIDIQWLFSKPLNLKKKMSAAVVNAVIY